MWEVIDHNRKKITFRCCECNYTTSVSAVDAMSDDGAFVLLQHDCKPINREAIEMDLRELIQATLSWAADRGIFDKQHGANTLSQHAKLFEEVLELRDALVSYATVTMPGDEGYLVKENMREHSQLELGDCIVVLIMIAELMGTSIEECLGMAYEKIKDRKGRMINGKFVKEEDL